jgi:hypothetical protein
MGRAHPAPIAISARAASMDVVARTEGKLRTALVGVRQKVRELDRALPLSTAGTLDE